MRDFKNTQSVEAPTKWMRVRVSLMGGAFILAFVALFTRAWQLQVKQEHQLKGLAQDQYRREMDLPARRGDIVDRHGTQLAQSVDVDSVWVDPSMLPDVRPAARALGKALSVDPRELNERLSKGNRFAWVKRQATPQEVAKVAALGLPGVGFVKEPRRFYPQRELASHVVGLVGTDAHGLDGLELAFEDELSGDDIKRSTLRDAKGRRVYTQGVEDPRMHRGAAVTLTLDGQLQTATERALNKAVEDAKATAGMAVVLDPKTGELLAVANAPTFNPNAPQGTAREAFRNRAVTDAFEPGSTFKAFVVAAALDKKAITTETEFDCEKGRWGVGRYTVHDTHPHGVLKPQGVLQVSSNICAAKIGQKLGREALVDAYQRFGFGERAGLGLPGEGKGVVPFPKADITFATESFGQGLTATAVQIAAGYGALANGGVLMRPYLVAKVVDPDGAVLLENKPTAVRQVVSEKAARQVVAMLETVVEKEGTAPRARMDQYRVAGKTGTAQKVEPGGRGYSDKRVASFAGMVPAEDPRLVVLVVIDEPKTDVYGGLVAAPAFKEIASQAMSMLGVKPSREAPPVDPKKAGKPAPVLAEAPVVPEPKVEAVTSQEEPELPVAAGGVRVPDVAGLAGRQAVSRVLTASLEPRLVGSGRVVAQHPAAGAVVDRGTRVTLELAGRLPAPNP